jgi:peroxiredoxin
LSDHQGEVVWLVFWRVGCPPCRYEFPHLEKLYKEFKDDGFLVLGFNCADGKDYALEFLREYSITFPNIVDSSSVARAVFIDDYQKFKSRSAVPLNYIIDKNGKVADCWYGFDKDDDRGYRNINDLIVE